MNVSDYWQERDFVLPPGGVKEGLCGKFLKISRVKNYYSTAEGKGPINEQ